MSKILKFKLTFALFFLTILIFSFLILNLFASYSGTYHGSLMNTWQYALGQYSYAKDVFLQDNIFTETSIIFSLFSFLKINMTNDYVGFTWHIFLSLLSGVFLFKILKEFTLLKDINLILVILFSLLAIDGKFFLVDSNYASWIIRHTGTTSHIGHSLIFIFFWALLKEKNIFLIILTPIMLLISVKSTFFSIGIGMLYSIFSDSGIRKKLWILFPICTILYMSSINVYSGTNDYETNKILFDHLIEREGEEASFHLQPKIKLFLFLISFPVFYFLTNKLDNEKLKKLSKIILFSSIICFLWGYFYHLYGGKFWPVPKLAALGPTRAVEVYELFFAVLLALFINKINTTVIIKIGLYCALYYIPYGFKGTVVGLSILIFILIFSFIYKKFRFNFFKEIFLEKMGKFSNLATALFFLLLFPSVIYTISTKEFDTYALKKISKWKTGPLYGEHSKIDSAVLLQKCDDFILLDPIGKNWTNVIAGKSQYVDFTRLGINLFSIKLHNLMKERGPVYEDIVKSIDDRNLITSNTHNRLIKDGVVLLVKKENAGSFSSDVKKINLNSNDILILFLDEKEEKLFDKNCLNKIL